MDLLLDSPHFGCVRVHGRRRVGKSELLRQAFSRRPGRPPLVMIDLPEPPEGDAGMALRRLADAVSAAGVSLEEQPMAGRCDPMRFESLLRRFIHGGTAVVLDDFQNASGLGLVSAVKTVIDGVPINRHSPDGGSAESRS